MKPGDIIVTQTYKVGRVTRVEDPRVYYIPLDVLEAKPVQAWLARVAVIPPDVVNQLFGAGETEPVEDAVPEPVRYQPVPTLTLVQPTSKAWYTKVLDWFERMSAA